MSGGRRGFACRDAWKGCEVYVGRRGSGRAVVGAVVGAVGVAVGVANNSTTYYGLRN